MLLWKSLRLGPISGAQASWEEGDEGEFGVGEDCPGQEGYRTSCIVVTRYLSRARPALTWRRHCEYGFSAILEWHG